MMTQNPVLLTLFEEAASNYPYESNVKRAVRREVQINMVKGIESRSHWFGRRTMAPASVLARMKRHDRDAVIAHFRAKELRIIADARNAHDDYSAGLAIKRLDRVNEMAKSFTEVDKEGWRAA